MKIKKSDFEDHEWPFEFSTGELLRAPEPWNHAVVVMNWASGKVYALNGVAAPLPFTLALEPEWRDNPDFPPGCGKIDIGPMIARALAL